MGYGAAFGFGDGFSGAAHAGRFYLCPRCLGRGGLLGPLRGAFDVAGAAPDGEFGGVAGVFVAHIGVVFLKRFRCFERYDTSFVRQVVRLHHVVMQL